MLTREQFKSAVAALKREDDAAQDIRKIIRELGNGCGELDWNSPVHAELRKLLKVSMHDIADWIEWWMYETDDFHVSWEENGETVEADLKEVDALYDFLINNAATIPAEKLPIEDISTSEESPLMKQAIDLDDFQNCFESVLSYLDNHDVALHILREGEPKYVIMNMQCYERLFGRDTGSPKTAKSN